MNSVLDRATAAWGEEMPDWVQTLATECGAMGQRRAAEVIGYSQSMVSQVLARKYTGATAGIESAVRGAWLGATVDCPSLGDIPTTDCRDWRKRARQPFTAVNRVRSLMWDACRACPLNPDRGAHDV